MARKGSPPPAAFDVLAFLETADVPRRVVRCPRNAKVFAQGTAATSVFVILEGCVKVTVLSSSGKEAVVHVLGNGDFIGEPALAGQVTRLSTATAVIPTTVLRIHRRDMLAALRDHPAFAERLLEHMVDRITRLEEALADQLFNSSEKRLARALLTLARYGSDEDEDDACVLPKLSQETLAEMVGTTRSRVNFFMNKFRKLGLIHYDGVIKIRSALLAAFLHDGVFPP